VRTLHYYDEIGLVSPGERTSAGHRRYAEEDVRRLYRVLALSGLGFSLDEIAKTLTRPDDPAMLRELLTAQLADLEAKADRIAGLRRRVRGLLNRLEGPHPPGPEHFLSTLEPLILHSGTYFSRHQHESLARHRAGLGDEEIEALKAEWLELLARLRRHQTAGTPVDDPGVRELALRWEEIGTVLGTGDERIETAATALWQDNQAEISRRLGERMGWADADALVKVVGYLQRARQATQDHEEEGRTP
jgi:DNA-binding transcriptional MerR regulator